MLEELKSILRVGTDIYIHLQTYVLDTIEIIKA